MGPIDQGMGLSQGYYFPGPQPMSSMTPMIFLPQSVPVGYCSLPLPPMMPFAPQQDPGRRFLGSVPVGQPSQFLAVPGVVARATESGSRKSSEEGRKPGSPVKPPERSPAIQPASGPQGNASRVEHSQWASAAEKALPAEKPVAEPKLFRIDSQARHAENPGRRATPEQEESLEALPMSEACNHQFKGNSYKYRNVYKSVVRNMYSYIKNNKADIMKILGCAGYNRAAIEHAFLKISDYNDKEHKRGGNKMAQEIVKKMLFKRNIYAFILREATNAMLQNSRSGKFGRVASKNAGTYITAVETIYKESVAVLDGHEAEGSSFIL